MLHLQTEKAQEVAVKYPRDSGSNSERTRNIYENEIKFLRFVKHSFIVRLLALVTTDGNPPKRIGEAYLFPLSKCQ